LGAGDKPGIAGLSPGGCTDHYHPGRRSGYEQHTGFGKNRGEMVLLSNKKREVLRFKKAAIHAAYVIRHFLNDLRHFSFSPYIVPQG